jgi:hypothetical protein
MGLGIGVPQFVKSLAHDAKKGVEKVASAAQHPVRTVENAGKTVAHDTFAAANDGFQYLTSQKDKRLDRDELKLADIAADSTKPKSVRDAAREKMRNKMGAEPLDRLDALPAAASAKAEQRRFAGASTWEPSREPAGSKAQWATNDAGGKRKSDPVNLYVHGKLSDIVRAFQKGGWSIANNGPGATGDYVKAMGQYALKSAEGTVPFVAGVGQSEYHDVNKMPVGNLFLNGRLPLVSMEANNHPETGRDHFRIFFTGKKDPQGNNIYAVTASRDEGQKLDPSRSKTAFTNHYTQSNADAERDYVLKTLQASGAQVAVRTLNRSTAGGPKNGLYSADGNVYDLTVG